MRHLTLEFCDEVRLKSRSSLVEENCLCCCCCSMSFFPFFPTSSRTIYFCLVDFSKDDCGQEGIAVKKNNGGEKTMKIGKRLSSILIKQREHDGREDAEAAAAKNKENLAVAAATQDGTFT